MDFVLVDSVCICVHNMLLTRLRLTDEWYQRFIKVIHNGKIHSMFKWSNGNFFLYRSHFFLSFFIQIERKRLQNEPQQLMISNYITNIKNRNGFCSESKHQIKRERERKTTKE